MTKNKKTKFKIACNRDLIKADFLCITYPYCGGKDVFRDPIPPPPFYVVPKKCIPWMNEDDEND